MTTESLITPEMRATIGVEGPPRRLEVDRSAIRMFARAVGHTDLIFYVVEEARRRGYRDLVAPPGFLGRPSYTPTSELFPESRWKHLPRSLNGGAEYEYFDVVVAGDVLEGRGRTVDMVERMGRLGPMVITFSETVYTRLSDGKVVVKARGSGIIY